MKCPQCRQHNPLGRDRCWNCGEPLEQPHIGDQPGAETQDTASTGAPPAADSEVSELGVLGPLRLERRTDGPVDALPGPPQPDAAERRMSRFLVSSIIGGAISGGAALAGLFALLAATGFQPGGVSAGATVLVSVVRGFIMGAVNGAIIGALVAYYGGGIWGGAMMGAALVSGMWLVQAVFSGVMIPAVIPAVMLTAVVLAIAGGAMGALVGAVVESISPHRV